MSKELRDKRREEGAGGGGRKCENLPEAGKTVEKDI